MTSSETEKGLARLDRTMAAAVANTPSAARASAPPGQSLDMQDLIVSAQAIVQGWVDTPVAARPLSRATFDARADMRWAETLKSSGAKPIVLAHEVAVELGPPSLRSCALLLTTSTPSVVHHGRVTLVGPDLQQVATGARLPFAQIVMLAMAGAARPDPFSVENTQYLMHQLPGYMARSIPGRLWVRVSRAAHASGLTLLRVGQLLVQTYLSRFPEIAGAEVVFVTSRDDDVEAFRPLVLEAQVIAGLHRKLAISPDGDLACTELACDTCEEKPVCDGLREMLQQRGRRR